MQFFRYFPTTPYTFADDTGEQFNLDITNSTIHVIIKERLRQNITTFYDYEIRDGERPDTVAEKVYGSVNYTWIVLLLNNIFTLFDWPLQPDEFDGYIKERYGSAAAAQAIPVYHTVSGFVVDSLTWATLIGSDRGSVTTQYDEELTANEAKRHIRVIPMEFVANLVAELKKVLS
jgi:hypothetical protein